MMKKILGYRVAWLHGWRYILAAGLICMAACTQQQTDWSEQTKADIIHADKTMSDLATKIGFYQSLLEYADADVVKPTEGELPVIGKTALIQFWAGKDTIKTLTWEPFKAEAAKSGELGYTLGNWKLVAEDSTFYGLYYTVWKKQADGSWKFVVDGGHNTPKPVE